MTAPSAPQTLHGEPITKWVPNFPEEWEMEARWEVNNLAETERRINHLAALPRDHFDNIPEWLVGDFIGPYMGWAWESFIQSVADWIPAEVPVPPEFDFRWFMVDRAKWPTLMYASPWGHLFVDTRGHIHHVIDMAAEPQDSMYSATYSLRPHGKDPKVWSGNFVEIGWWGEDGEHMILDRGGDQWQYGPWGAVYLPPKPGEIAMRFANWTLDQTGEKGTGEWGPRMKIGKGYDFQRDEDRFTAWTLTKSSPMTTQRLQGGSPEVWGSPARAEDGFTEPYLDIGDAGDPAWTPPAPKVWTPPPPPPPVTEESVLAEVQGRIDHMKAHGTAAQVASWERVKARLVDVEDYENGIGLDELDDWLEKAKRGRWRLATETLPKARTVIEQKLAETD